MASRGNVFARVFFLQISYKFGWTFLILSGVMGVVENFDHFQPPKSPTTCGSRPKHCSPLYMPWSCPQSECFPNYTYRFDDNSGNKSRLTANLSAAIYYYNISKAEGYHCMQVLNLTWTVRLNDSDFPVIGFRLQFDRLMPSKNLSKKLEALLFTLRPRQVMPVDKHGNTMFYYDCMPLSIASKYPVQLFSRHQSTDSERFERLIGTMNLRTDCDVYPEGHFTKKTEYRGFVNYSTFDSNCNILASFSPASDSFGFKGYDVQLWSNDKLITIVQNLTFTCKNVEPVPLRIESTGSYKIRVIPVGGRCPCSDCKACSGFESNFFNVSKPNYECPTTMKLPNMLTLSTTDPMPDYASVHGSEGPPMATKSAFNINQTVIILVTAVIVISVFVLAVVVLRFKSRKRRGGISVSTEEIDASGGDLTRQPVVLIYASDNGFHSEVVHCLAAYLQNHCHCDVRFDQWFQTKISEVSALDWILHQLRSVKNVIVINSEAGFRQYNTEVAYGKILHETPLEDMFLPAMLELHSDYYRKPKCRKLFKVAFPYTDPQFFLNDFHSGMTYKLMTHIEDLVLTIHGLSKSSRRGKTRVAGINHTDYIQSPEGLALEKAIREATEYFKQNPNWFSDFYRIKKSENQHRVCSSMDKDWTKEHLTLQDSSFYKSDPLSEYDSGFCMSTESQTRAFKAPHDDDDDGSSMSSANIELQAVMLNKDFDCTLSLAV